MNPKDQTHASNPKDQTHASNSENQSRASNPKDQSRASNPKDQSRASNPKDQSRASNPKDQSRAMSVIKKTRISLLAALTLASSIVAAYYRFGRIRLTFPSGISAAFAAVSLLFLTLELYERKNPRRAAFFRKSLYALFFIGFAVFASAAIPVMLEAKTDDDPQADYLIVLGAGLNGSAPSVSLAERLDAAADYLTDYPDAIAIVSGGQGAGEDISEAEAMHIWLERRGIPSERIIREDRSTSTAENIAYSLAIIDELDPHASIAIVSSEYHLHRAKEYARAFGVEPIGVAARTSNRLLFASYFIREGCGVLYMRVFGLSDELKDFA